MRLREKIRIFVILTASTLIMAVGIYFFKFPNNFTFGGITGLSVVIAKTGIMTASRFTFAANMLLLLLGFIFLGKGLGIMTTYCSVLLSVTLDLMEKFIPLTAPLTDQPMMELLFAVAVPALASALLFNIGATSGGTDIVAMILRKYSSVDIGQALMLSDVIVTISAFFVFDIKTGLYSVLGLSIRSFMVDSFIESFNLHKYFNVVCDKPGPICDYITHTLHRSATVCEAKGAFSGDDKYIVFTVLNRVEAVKLRNFIKVQEPHAFILISNTSQIIGKGFHTV